MWVITVEVGGTSACQSDLNNSSKVVISVIKGWFKEKSSLVSLKILSAFCKKLNKRKKKKKKKKELYVKQF